MQVSKNTYGWIGANVPTQSATSNSGIFSVQDVNDLIGSNENGNFLKSEANNAASGLGKEIVVDLNKTPFINITWKICCIKKSAKSTSACNFCPCKIRKSCCLISKL